MKTKTEISETMPFGKYKGWPINEIASHDPKYIRWLLENKYIRLGIALSQQGWIKKFEDEDQNGTS